LAFITRNKPVVPARQNRLILASQSPRRKKILQFLSIPFRVVKPRGVDESPFLGERAPELVKRLSLNKALAVAKRYPYFPILAADTVVSQNGKIYGKPKDALEALKMIQSLQGTMHEVWTGTALIWEKYGIRESHSQKTTVFFRRMEFREIKEYVQTKEPYDKAGAYDIQATASHWIKKWEGDYFNVMGLPIQWVVQQMAKINRLEKF
jgi:septum formation protein